MLDKITMNFQSSPLKSLPRNSSKRFPVMLSCFLVDLIMSRCEKQLPLIQKLMEERLGLTFF